MIIKDKSGGIGICICMCTSLQSYVCVGTNLKRMTCSQQHNKPRKSRCFYNHNADATHRSTTAPSQPYTLFKTSDYLNKISYYLHLRVISFRVIRVIISGLSGLLGLIGLSGLLGLIGLLLIYSIPDSVPNHTRKVTEIQVAERWNRL